MQRSALQGRYFEIAGCLHSASTSASGVIRSGAGTSSNQPMHWLPAWGLVRPFGRRFSDDDHCTSGMAESCAPSGLRARMRSASSSPRFWSGRLVHAMISS